MSSSWTRSVDQQPRIILRQIGGRRTRRGDLLELGYLHKPQGYIELS